MNYFVHHQHQEYDPSSQNQESYHQFTNNGYSYSYSYPNPQFTSSIHPYSYQNPLLQPSQHAEQEPNPPGVTPPPPPPPPPPEVFRNSYYQYHAHGGSASVPTAGPQSMDTGIQTVVHQPIVQPLFGGAGIMDGLPRGDPQTYLGPKLDVSNYPFRVDGRDGGQSLPKNAAIPFQDHSATAYGGIHIQGGPCQLPSQSYGEPRHGPRPKVSGRTYRGRGRGKGCVQRKRSVAPAQDRKLLFQGKPEIQGAAASLPMVQSGASSFGQTLLLPLQVPAHSASVSPSPKVVSCELCKVECNTLEVLQQHVNGKKHKKKLKVFEEIQNIDKKVNSGQAYQAPTKESKSEVVSLPDRVEEGTGNQQLQQAVLPSQEINEEREVAGEKGKMEEVEPRQESAKRMRVDRCEHFKHKLRGGKSNRKMRPSDRSKSLVQLPKPKEVAPLVCELCNVKCESLVVFQSHLAGKKHKSKARHFLSQERIVQELPQAQRPASMQGFGAYQVASAQNVDNMTSGEVEATSQPESIATNSGSSFLVTTAAGGTWNEGRPEPRACSNCHGAEMVGVAAGSEQAVTCGTTLDGGSSSELNVVSTRQPPPNS